MSLAAAMSAADAALRSLSVNIATHNRGSINDINGTNNRTGSSRSRGLWPIPSPLAPDTLLLGLDLAQCRVMGSSKYPLLLTFRSESAGVRRLRRRRRRQGRERGQGEGEGEGEGVLRLLFKGDDEARQDEFMLRAIGIIDRVALARALVADPDPGAGAGAGVGAGAGPGEDENYWCLTHYRVLAIGHRSGVVEWAADASTLADIIARYGGDNPLQAYLRFYHPQPEHPYGIDKAVMETFVRSCAAYSVLSYVLGVGDRHLDNLMLRSTGAFLHVDFGYVFGREPKPFAQPVRFTAEMASCLGGEGSALFTRCMLLVDAAFIAIRSHSGLVLNLLRVMGDAGIADLSVKQPFPTAVSGVKKRLFLHMSDAEACIALRGQVREAHTALIPPLMEALHRVAVSFR